MALEQTRHMKIEWTERPQIDLRYEVMGRPTKAMWAAMESAELGMAAMGEDKQVIALEDRVSELLGLEAAFFVPTTTIGTVLTMMCAGLRDKQIIMESRCHLYWVEGFHFADFAGAVPRLIRGDKFGQMDLREIEEVIGQVYYGYQVPTGLICLENTHNVCGGTVLSTEYTKAVADLAHENGMAVFLDGARLWHSAVTEGVPISQLASPADYVVVSLGKGLGCPMGAVLCGPQAFIEEARRAAKRMGTIAIHKAGIFAAAALVALDTMLDRLVEDHRRARYLAERLQELPSLSIDLDTVQTNLIRAEVVRSDMDALQYATVLASHGLAVQVMEPRAIKMGLYYEIDDALLDKALEVFQQSEPQLAAGG